MPFKQKISQHFDRSGRSHSHHHTFGQDMFAGGGGSAFPHHRLVLLLLALLDVVLLIAAVVIGIYCASAKDFQDLDPAATPLVVEMNLLKNYSGIISDRVEAEKALEKVRADHLQLKMQVKEKLAVVDVLQRNIEVLQEQKRLLQLNKTTLEENCSRCPPGWRLLRSTCYYYSHHKSLVKKNWNDSRADCESQGGDLVVIDSPEEQRLLSDNFPRMSGGGMLWWHNGFWSGLLREGRWHWVNNMTEVDSTYWRSGQPNASGPQSGNCGALMYTTDSMKTWYNANCQNHWLNWICEMEPRET